MARKRSGYVQENKDTCWGFGDYCTWWAKSSFVNCSSCGVEAECAICAGYECAVCQFQKLETENPGWGCQCTNAVDGGNRKLILDTRAKQLRAKITHMRSGDCAVEIGLPHTVIGPIKAAWDEQEAELWAQQRAGTHQSSAAQPAQFAQQPVGAPQYPTVPLPPPTKAAGAAFATAFQQRLPQQRPEPGIASSAVLASPPGLGPNDRCPVCGCVRNQCMCHVLPDSEPKPKPTWLAERSGNYSGIPDHPTFEPQLQMLVEHLQAAAEAIGAHVATLGEKVAAMETEPDSEASAVVNKIDDIHMCLQAINQKVNSVVDLHGSIDEMQKKYDGLKAAGEATSEKLNKAIAALRRKELLSSGSGDTGASDSLSLSTDAAGPEADLESSAVVVEHEQDNQFGTSENHVSKTH